MLFFKNFSFGRYSAKNRLLKIQHKFSTTSIKTFLKIKLQIASKNSPPEGNSLDNNNIHGKTKNSLARKKCTGTF